MADHPNYGIVDAILTPLFLWKLAGDMQTRFGDSKAPVMHFIFWMIPLYGLLIAWQDVNTISAAMKTKGQEASPIMLLILMMIPLIGPFMVGNKLNELGDVGAAPAADSE